MIARYTTLGGNNNSDDIQTVFAPDGVCFVENILRLILKNGIYQSGVERKVFCTLSPNMIHLIRVNLLSI